MEKRINQKTRTYLQQFKNDIKEYVTSKQCINKDITDSLLQFVYDYQPLEFQKTDFQKRKRVKNIVPYFERCCALRANGQQCTRRRKNSDKFCLCGKKVTNIMYGRTPEYVPLNFSKITHI